MTERRRPPFASTVDPSTEQSRIDDLQLWAMSAGASSWIVDLRPYEAARVAGVVQKLRIAPLSGEIEALVWDGTGEVLARWHIRQPLPQLAVVPGRLVLLEGVPIRADDVLVMLEPDFRLASPAAA